MGLMGGEGVVRTLSSARGGISSLCRGAGRGWAKEASLASGSLGQSSGWGAAGTGAAPQPTPGGLRVDALCSHRQGLWQPAQGSALVGATRLGLQRGAGGPGGRALGPASREGRG